MGFTNPEAAFRNFHRLLKPGGRLAFCCWRQFQDNELDRFPLLAVGIASPVDATPFSFSDPDYIRRVLISAGYREIAIIPYDEAVSSGSADAMTDILLKIGPLGKIARENPKLRAEAEPKLRQALADISMTTDVSLVASVWIVTALK